MVHIFADYKNDYWVISNYSDDNGIVCITKQMLEEKINVCRNMFIMDYSCDLDHCKPYIEILARDGNEIKTQMNILKENWMPFNEEAVRKFNHLKGCKNHLIYNKSIKIDVDQGSQKQKIDFKAELIRKA